MDQTSFRENSYAVSASPASVAFSASEGGMAGALIAVGALLRIVSFYFSDNCGGDAGAHAALAAEWLGHPSLKFVFDTYPPGHFWLIGLFWLPVRNVVLAGRLLSLVSGIGSIFFVWRLACFLYGASAGFYSVAAFSLYSLHIGYSTTSSAEVPYLFFLLAATYFFFSAFAAGRERLDRVVLSGVCFSVAESIRYEAWIFFFALFVSTAVVWFWRRRFRSSRRRLSALLWLVTAGAWPVFMMAYSWHAFGDPMHLVSLNRVRVSQSLATTSVFHQLAVMPTALLVSVSPLVIIAAALGLAISFSADTTVIFATATIFFAIVEGYEVLTGGLLATARYTITLGTMLCLVSGSGCELIFQRLIPTQAKVARSVVVGLLSLNCALMLCLSLTSNRLADEFASVSPLLRYHPHIVAIADYLRAHMGPNDAAVFDNYNDESNILADAAGLPVPPGRRAYLASKKNEVTFLQYIEAEHPRFLVYSDQGTLRRWLDLRPECVGTQQIDQIEYRCVLASQVYRIYELSYR